MRTCCATGLSTAFSPHCPTCPTQFIRVLALGERSSSGVGRNITELFCLPVKPVLQHCVGASHMPPWRRAATATWCAMQAATCHCPAHLSREAGLNQAWVLVGPMAGPPPSQVDPRAALVSHQDRVGIACKHDSSHVNALRHLLRLVLDACYARNLPLPAAAPLAGVCEACTQPAVICVGPDLASDQVGL